MAALLVIVLLWSVVAVVRQVVWPGSHKMAMESVVPVVADITGGAGLLHPVSVPRRGGDLACEGQSSKDRTGRAPCLAAATLAARFGRNGREQEGTDLLAAYDIVLRHHVGEILVGLDRDEGVEIQSRKLAPDANRTTPPAHLSQLLLQLCSPNQINTHRSHSSNETKSQSWRKKGGKKKEKRENNESPEKGRDRCTESTRVSPPT